MTKTINSLIEILEEEKEVYKILVDLAVEKKQVIIENRVKDLERITLKEQTLSSRIMKLENRRGDVIETIMEEEGITNIQTLSDLANRLDPLSREALNKGKSQLLKTIDNLKKNNDLNGELIAQSLRFIEFNLSIVADTEEDSRYGKGMAEHKVLQKKSIFDVKV